MKNATSSIRHEVSLDKTLFKHGHGDPSTLSTTIGLRERKRLELRQNLSDTATAMFLKSGFNNVCISEIAEACNVSEKTVYNHFPVKESLLLDQEQSMADELRIAFTQSDTSLVNAMVMMLNNEVTKITSTLSEQKDWNHDLDKVQQFFNIIETTPSLHSYQQDIMDRLTTVLAVTIAERINLTVESPEPQIIAEALIGLWKIQHRTIRRYTNGKYKPLEILKLVNNEVLKAASVLTNGVRSIET
jgi:AcrR family transcriptional regulator